MRISDWSSDVCSSDLAADEHGLEFCRRRGRAGAADVDDDVLDDGGLLLRRELVRDRPARRAADKAQFALRGHVVDLVDDAVEVERQRITLRADLPVIGQATFRSAWRAPPRTPRDAKAAPPRTTPKS